MNLHFLLEILGILVPLIHLTGMGLAAHATLFARTSQGAIAWALSLVFFPYAAIPLYLVFGRKKFHGYVESRRKGDRLIDHVADNLLAAARPATLSGDCQRFDVFNHLAMIPFTSGNNARLLVDGADTFNAIFQAVDEARSYLLVQFFILRDDALGRDLQERLIKRAAQGLRVYLLYDEIGCLTLAKSYTTGLRDAGVHVHAFNTRRGWRNRFQINFRNHRKIVVADGRIAHVGGHNVGDEYLGKSPRFGRWRDTHVELTGPAVAAVQWSFIQDWHWATGDILELPNKAGDGIPGPPVKAGDAIPGPPPASPPPTSMNAIVITSGPADDIPTCTFMFVAAISAARRRLWIASPYFVPDETVYDALQLAALRGVDVRIMLPAKPDHLLVYLSSFSYLESAEHVGVKFYRYQSGFLHQKVMLIDDDLAAVGTANLDNRSMRLNFEMTVLFADPSFAAQTAAMLEKDFAQCERATPGDLGRRALPFRIAVRIARLLSPIQ